MNTVAAVIAIGLSPTCFFFFFNDTATTEIYTLSLHDALPISSFTGKRGHTTDVTESVAPGVTSEHIKPTRHEEITEAVDREVHQDHYHTTIQPIQHQEVLPEQHHYQMKDVIDKEFNHSNDHETRQRLERETAQFKNTNHTHETRHTTAVAPRVEGEHVHHHIH